MVITNFLHVKDHPRLRGEKILKGGYNRPLIGSSPLTRGKVLQHSTQRVEPGIIPAYAGKSQSLDVWHLADEDHPRLRGEKR